MGEGDIAMITDTATRARWSHLRLRQTKHLRDLVAETSFTVDQLIQPLFIVEGMTGAQPITGLGANARLSETAALDVMAKDLDAGVRHFLLFAIPNAKSRVPARFDHLRADHHGDQTAIR